MGVLDLKIDDNHDNENWVNCIVLNVDMEFLLRYVKEKHLKSSSNFQTNTKWSPHSDRQSYKQGTTSATVLCLVHHTASDLKYRTVNDTVSREIMDILKPWLDNQTDDEMRRTTDKLLKYFITNPGEPKGSGKRHGSIKYLLAKRQCGLRFCQDKGLA